MAGDFDLYYSNEPISGLSENQRSWYDPILRDVFKQRMVWSQFGAFTVNNGDVNAETMTITSMYDLHTNVDPLGVRQLWLPAAHVDTFKRTITFSRFGNKVAYHRYDDILTYWAQLTGVQNVRNIPATASPPRRVWERLLRGKLGQNMVATHDRLIRNAYLDAPFTMYAGGASSFGNIATDDLMTTSLIRDIHLGMSYRNIPYAQNPSGSIGGQTVFCITSPGVLHDLMNETGSFGQGHEWIPTNLYSNPSAVANYEIGSWQNIRWIKDPSCTLWNCGAVTKQVTITSPISAGDGVSATVDTVKSPGQTAATHYVQCSDFDASDFSVGDIVTLHVDRTSDNGVTNGVDYTDGTIHDLRVTAVDASNNQLSFATPVMLDFKTDLTGAGVYAYLTKGRHIHASVFIGAPYGVVVGVGQPPRTENPIPVDDFNSMFRLIDSRPAQQCAVTNRGNCWKPLRAPTPQRSWKRQAQWFEKLGDWAISSRASKGVALAA